MGGGEAEAALRNGANREPGRKAGERVLRVCLAAGWVGVQDRARYLKAGGGGGAGGVRGPRNQSIAVGEGSEGGGGVLPQVGAACQAVGAGAM